MAPQVNSAESVPLYDENDDNLHEADIEKYMHVVESSPRELFDAQPASSAKHLTLYLCPIFGICAVVFCWLTFSAGEVQDKLQAASAYNFVGEGNCGPNRPQWHGESPYDECRETCDSAAACIGFDWDAKYAYCRVRFATNVAMLAAPPPGGFHQARGVEGAKMNGQKTELFKLVGDNYCVSAAGADLPDTGAFAGDQNIKACQEQCAQNASCSGIEWYPTGDSNREKCFIHVSPARVASASRGQKWRDAVCYKKQDVIDDIVGSHTAGCFQKALSIPFYTFLAVPKYDGWGNALVGPLPNIFEYYSTAGLDMPLQHASRHLKEDDGMLTYNGRDGELILPSLDAVPLMKTLRKKTLPNVTIIIGVNSDSYNRGLGIVIEASPQINETDEHQQKSYTYNGYGVHSNRNVVKFHPDMDQGELRLEGPGGFNDKAIGFTPPSWSTSGQKLNTLEVTLSSDGKNEILLRSADSRFPENVWSRTWTHKLFDGRDIPSVYAFIDLGGEEGKPLIVGQVSLRVKK